MLSKTIKKVFFLCFSVISHCVFGQITNPTAISGLECWYAADSNVILNGSNVFKVKDLSNNGFDITQSSVSTQPTLLTNQINNKPTIRFDALDDFLPITDSIDFRTIIVLAKTNELSFPDYKGLLGGALSSFSTGGYLINAVGGTTNLGLGVNTSAFTKIKRNASDVTINGNFFPIDNFWVGLFEYSFNRKQLADIGRIDNGTQAGRYWNGDIAEIIVFNKTLNPSELILLENYISKKYTSGVSLGSDIIISSNSVCDTTLRTSINFSEYLWSNGATTPTISVNQPGNYWVRVINDFGFYSYDTISIQYPNFNQIDLDTILCANSTILWNTNLSLSNFSFIWQDNSNNPNYTITQEGNYYVKITDSNGCFITSDTVKVLKDDFPSFASLGSDTSLCAGNSILLTNGSQSGVSYLWNDTSTNSSLIINSSGQYWVIATNANNCVAEDTINVTIVGQAPIAGFENSFTCQNNSVDFNDTSFALGGAVITQWLWDFGDLSTILDVANVSQPNYTYADTGAYTINLTVTTDVSCKQNLTKNIYIYPNPIVDFTNIIACQKDTAFFNEAINPLGYPITNYQWNFGDGATSVSSDPFHIFSQNINYQVQLIATNNQGCIDSITKPITVRDEVSADFNYSTACINVPISFTDNSIAPSPNTSNIRNWYFFPGTATGLSATKTYSTAGSFSVSLKVTGFNNCISRITKQIQVFLPPDADFTSSTICIADSFQLTDASLPINGVINLWQWKFVSNTFSNIQHPKYILNTSGNLNIFLKVSNDKGCIDSVTKVIYVNPLPDASFNLNPSVYLFNDAPISFTPNFSSAVNYFWNVSDGNTYSDPSLNLTFINQGAYTVSLQLTDYLGCKNNSSQAFNVGVRNTDLGIIAARSTIDKDGFVGVEADLYNYGSTPITEFEILYELTGGGIMKETWTTDTLPPAAVLLLKFSSKAFLSTSERENAISCITIQTVNTKVDDNIANNENCAALNSDKQLVAEPYPNPADGDVTIPIVLTEDQTISIIVYDYLGKLIAENLTYNGVTGLNFIKIPSVSYSSGTYTLKISISESTYIRKLIKQGSSK